jgi:hypothetical protein
LSGHLLKVPYSKSLCILSLGVQELPHHRTGILATELLQRPVALHIPITKGKYTVTQKVTNAAGSSTVFFEFILLAFRILFDDELLETLVISVIIICKSSSSWSQKGAQEIIAFHP